MLNIQDMIMLEKKPQQYCLVSSNDFKIKRKTRFQDHGEDEISFEF